mgnify:CR=1 FL=1
MSHGVEGQGQSEAVSQSEYARRRGISEAMVSKYKSSGCLALDSDGRVLVRESDVLLADVLDPLRGGNRNSPAGQDKVSYLAAKTEEARARAAKASMEAELMAGSLVRVAEVEAEAFARARGAQELLMALPDRMSPLLAVESDPAKVHELLTDELRRVCQAIAEIA